MTSIQAPAWAFTAEAIDGVGDTHLPPGVHVRALPAPSLGLPATPLAVYRGTLNPDLLKRLALSAGVVWVDSHGNTLTEPFQVTPDNPVSGYFPLPDVVWAELQATPAEIVLVRPPRPVFTIDPVIGRATPSLHVDTAAVTLNPAVLNPAVLSPTIDLGPVVARPLTRRAALRFEALVHSAQGPAVSQCRRQAPYALAGWTLPQVRVVGQGTVHGLRWLPAARTKDLQGFALWEVWSLPLKKPTARYMPTANALPEAEDRVQRAAVLRQPLHVAYNAASPASAPPAAGADAVARIAQVEPELQRWLDVLLNDLSAPPSALLDQHPIQGVGQSTVGIPIEPFLLAGAVDPDVGHYLGLGDVDRKVDAPPGSLVVYRVRGLWRWEPKRWHKLQLAGFAPAVRKGVEDAVKNFPELKELDVVPPEKGPFVDLHTHAVALMGTPPDAPQAVQFTAAQDRGWLAAPPPPHVRRALRLLASGFGPHAVAALAATDSAGLRTLHPFARQGRALFGKPMPSGTPLPLVVSRPAEALTPGEGRFEDRDAPDGAVDYQLAQGDWFGRWSGWAHRVAPAKARTAPMKPTLELYPQTAPALVPMPSPVPGGTYSPIVEVRIPIPRTPDLPAGGAALVRLDLVEHFEGLAPTTTGYTLGALVGASLELHAAPEHDLLVIRRTGPALARGGSNKLSYTARWVDSLAAVSTDADPAARTLVDPRPPAAPAVQTELRYTARPDVQGHARVDLDFASSVGTRYRVFASNETLLLKALDQSGQAAAVAAAADIRSALPGAPRAMKFKLYKALFGWDHFENLTPEPIVATASTTHFVHRVSGSLEVLAIYRVLGEGATGVLSEMSLADLVPFAVPNLGGPAQPQISVLNAGLEPTTAGVKLRVKVPRGKATPKAWRLRRASVPVNDPLRMDVVGQGLVTGAVVASEGTSFDIVLPEPLKAWRQYRFAVEVQADAPSGAPTVGVLLPGEWSPASAPAPLAVVAPAPPAAASSVVVTNAAGKLKVTLHHPAAASLVSTALGDHRFELWRVEPGKRPVALELLFKPGSGDTWVAADAGATAPTGTYVTVCVVDPIGRRSPATPSNPI